MQPLVDQNQKPGKGLSHEELIQTAQAILQSADVCLLVCDIVKSRSHEGFPSLLEQQQYFIGALKDVAERFGASLPVNTLRNGVETDRGFVVIAGDAATAGIGDASVIPQILAHLDQHYPKLKLRWSIARDGWDREGMRIIH
jgi:hypothetical protein